MPSQNSKINPIEIQILSHEGDSLGFTQMIHDGCGWFALRTLATIALSGGAFRTPQVIGKLFERLQRWIARYRAELEYAEARDRRRPTLAEMEWNGAMIGDLRRRSSDV